MSLAVSGILSRFSREVMLDKFYEHIQFDLLLLVSIAGVMVNGWDVERATSEWIVRLRVIAKSIDEVFSRDSRVVLRKYQIWRALVCKNGRLNIYIHHHLCRWCLLVLVLLMSFVYLWSPSKSSFHEELISDGI
jgi:hypothetical protein